MKEADLIKIEAIQIAEAFNIKKLRAEFGIEPYSGSPSEIFYTLSDKKRYLYIFDYGVVVFANYTAVEKKELILFVQNYATTIVYLDLFEEYLIEIDKSISKVVIKNDYVLVPYVDPSVLRIIMLNIGQSVALDYYEVLTDALITSSREYILELEQHGKLSISKINLLKYIGKVLNVKNSIVDNLYILDDPNIVWDNEELHLLNRHLKTNFDINPRFKDLDYRLDIVEDNLRLFTDVLNVRESSRLEWIVIILIFIEIMIALLFH
ncbi:RMD1 family protein [Flavobacterium sp. ZT3R18]|uniref:RMD1 family protein n=1 Tax=Flavobacterium sp. ZT3R18 TaxID=2594429 RepID=UPI001179D2CE|nr:RMD1 family protein [Flavobacterium sp. ZT3R18]TRX32749.1 RMD1 family protein [Flavobacterium sp. ZT3R18]